MKHANVVLVGVIDNWLSSEPAQKIGSSKSIEIMGMYNVEATPQATKNHHRVRCGDVKRLCYSPIVN